MSIPLYPHNEKAYRAANEMLHESGRAAVVHPTGTGKSYIAFRLVDDHRDSQFLWLSPSEYIFKTQLEHILRDAPDFPVESITFTTYARVLMMDEDALSALEPDYIILDEFHRCGAEQWGRGVNRLLAMYPKAKVLGLSATAIRYLDNNRNMAEELFQGHVASEMTLGEAIALGILPAPVYVSTLFRYQQELRRYQQRIDRLDNRAVRDYNQRHLDALRRALEQADGLDVIFHQYIQDKNGKYIVFCANIEHMRDMIAQVPEWFRRIDPNPHIFKVFSSDPEASGDFARFKEDSSNHLKLLFCIDMLNEGVHVPGISGVILFRPTVSPIVYKQQIGRALTSGTEHTPLIIDVVNNLDSIRSIDTLQDEMYRAVLWLRENGRGSEVVTERFHVEGQLQECRQLFENLERSLGSTWEQYFLEARAYSAAHENSLLSLPARYVTESGLSLGNWIMAQKKIRSGRQQGTLTDEQIQKLDSIGMVWENRLELRFEHHFCYAEKYAQNHGDLLVPASYVTEDGFRLGAWIATLRQQYNNGEQTGVLSQKRIERLNAIGMCWDVLDYQWEQSFAQAKEYYERHGDLQVPSKYVTESGFALGNWLNNLRFARAGKNRQTPPTPEQIARMDAIGMKWGNRFQERWMTYYQAAVRYHEEHPPVSEIPSDYKTPEGLALGRWIYEQKTALTKPQSSSRRLDQERIQLLQAIGIEMRKNPWEKKLSVASSYYAAFGTLDIAQDVVYEGVWLGKWLAQQRSAFRRRKLTSQQIHALDALGFQWLSKPERQWMSRYAEAKDYYMLHGDLVIPPSAPGLGRWLEVQRNRRQKGLLTEEQVQRLSGLGICWAVKKESLE